MEYSCSRSELMCGHKRLSANSISGKIKSKHIIGSEERHLLAQNTTCRNFQGNSLYQAVQNNV